MAALQALVLSLAVVVLPAVVAFMAAGSTAGGSLGEAVAVGLGAWLLGHGMPIGTTGATLTLIPLGISGLALFSCYASARRSAHTSVAAWVAATLTYTLGTFAIALLARTSTGWGIFLVLAGGLVLGGIGSALGVLARADAPGVRGLVRPWLDRLPEGVRPGLVGGITAASLLIAVGGVLTVAWAIAGRADTSDIIAGLAPGAVGGFVLALVQVALVPNLIVYGAAWVAGPGFQVGSSAFAPGSEELGPLPALPMLGGLPGEVAASSGAVWAPLIVVVCAAGAAVPLWRRLAEHGTPGLVATGTAVVSAAVTAGLVLAALVFLASGAIGPGSMEHVGADALTVGAWVVGEVLVGVLLTTSALLLRARSTDMES